MSLAAFSPRPRPPPVFSKRSFSFAIEFYRSLWRSHRLLMWMYVWVFPSPLMVSARALRRAGMHGELEADFIRGVMVTGPSGTGRLV